MPLCLAAAAGLGAAGGAAAQRLEVRAGMVLSSALAHDAIAQGSSPVTVRARLAPLAGAAALVPLRERLLLEVGAAVALSRLRAQDGLASRDVQSLTVVQALVGVRYGQAGRPYLRAAAGGVRYFSADRGVFAGGAGVNPALEAGAGWTRRAGAWRLGAELAGQLHPFDPPALEAAGAEKGGVRRLLLMATLSRGGRT